jgi:hypothetical protein
VNVFKDEIACEVKAVNDQQFGLFIKDTDALKDQFIVEYIGSVVKLSEVSISMLLILTLAIDRSFYC